MSKISQSDLNIQQVENIVFINLTKLESFRKKTDEKVEYFKQQWMLVANFLGIKTINASTDTQQNNLEAKVADN